MNRQIYFKEGIFESNDRVYVRVSELYYTQHVTLLRWMDENRIRHEFAPGGFYIFDDREQFEAFAARWYADIHDETVPKAKREVGCPYLPK